LQPGDVVAVAAPSTDDAAITSVRLTLLADTPPDTDVYDDGIWGGSINIKDDGGWG
jgi:hypothetical protein